MFIRKLIWSIVNYCTSAAKYEDAGPENNLEEDPYDNTDHSWVKSEAIPVEKLGWYNRSNMDAIIEQYQVG